MIDALYDAVAEIEGTAEEAQISKETWAKLDRWDTESEQKEGKTEEE